MHWDLTTGSFPHTEKLEPCFSEEYRLESLMNQYFANAEDVTEGSTADEHLWSQVSELRDWLRPNRNPAPSRCRSSICSKTRGDRIVTLTYFGEGATSANDFHAGMNFAGVYKTPTIFFCQNNHYAISVPVEKQTASETIAVKAKAYGFEGVRVDGNDILAVYRATKEAVDKARSNGGPTLIEAVTYRIGPHSSSDDPKRYRSNQELDEWQRRDPLVRFRKYLEKKQIWSEMDETKTQGDTNRQIDEAVAHAEKDTPTLA